MGNEISLVELFWGLRRRLWLIVTVMGLSVSLALVYVVRTPKIYRASSYILTVSTSGSSMLSRTSNASGMMGFRSNILVSEAFTSMMLLELIIESHIFAERVARKKNLMPVLFPEHWDEKKGVWKVADAEIPSFEDGADMLMGILSVKPLEAAMPMRIDAYLEDPDRAAAIANAAVEELHEFIAENQRHMAQRRRFFLEDRLKKNKQEMLGLGKKLMTYYESEGDITGTASIDVVLGPEMGFVSTTQGQETESGDGRTIRDVPLQVYLDQLSARLLNLGSLDKMLSEDHVFVQMDEERDLLAFKVLEKARPPTSPFKPQTHWILKWSCLLGLFGGIFLSLLTELVTLANRQKIQEPYRMLPT